MARFRVAGIAASRPCARRAGDARAGNARARLARALVPAIERIEPRRLMCVMHAPSFDWIEPDNQAQLSQARRALRPEPHSPDAATTPPPTGGRATADAVGIPALNSMPGAPAAIFLDFDGDTPSNTTAYDTNNDPAVFDAAEADIVAHAWEIVSTYFSMFHVNVTTQTPTVPFAWHITGNNINNGYSFVNVFPNSPTYQPRSFNNSSHARTRVSGIAHELGHNFGLQHQADFDALGNRTAEYTSGFDAQHGAIMGVDFAQKFHKWFIGHPTNNSGTLQDDLQIIADKLKPHTGGDGFRPDDISATLIGAAALGTSGAKQTAQGIIERRTDVDAFAFTSTGGRYLASVNPAVESGVDLKLEIYDADGVTLLASEDLASNDAQIAIDLPTPGTYFARVASRGNYGDVGRYDLVVSPVAPGFDAQDVNLLKRAGTTAYDPATGVWDIEGAGTDIWQTSDQFRYVFQRLTGNGSITARVLSFDGTVSSAKAGLMIRESLASGSRLALVDLMPGNQAEFIRRQTTNASAIASYSPIASAPIWLRLTRNGSTFTAERSTDGTSWTTIGSDTIAMGASVYIGMAVNSRIEATPALARFGSVSLTGALGPPAVTPNALPAPAGVAVGVGTGTGLAITWEAVAGATGYVIERSLDGVNFTSAGTANASATSYNDPNLAGSYRYFYRVSAADGAGRSPTSGVVHATNRPSAITGLTTMSVSTSRIVIDWRDTLGENGYRVERSVDGGTNWTTIATVGVNVPSYTDNTASSTGAHTFTYRITPTSALGDGPTSVGVTEMFRLPVVQSVKLDRIDATSATITWRDVGGLETGYKIERSSTGDTWTSVGTVGGDVTSFTSAGLTGLREYYWRVQATTPYTESLYGAVVFGATPPASTNVLPIGWSSVDIGAVAGPGASGHATGTFTSIAGGTDIGGVADQFRYTWQPVTGDGEIIARVTALDDAGVNTKGGVMFRESLASNARYASAHISDTSGLQFGRRLNPGTAALNTTAVAGDAPMWVRLVRAGTLFTAYRSTDGITWTSMGSDTIAMGANVYVGLAVSANTSVRLATVTFSNVSGSALGQPDTTAPATPVYTSISDDTGSNPSDRITSDATLTIVGTAEAGTTVTLSRSGGIVRTAQVDYLGNWRLDLSATPLVEGVNTFTLTARDGSNNASQGATFDVTLDTVAPAIASGVFDRALGHRWTVVLAEDVGATLLTGDFVITDLDTGASFTPLVTYDTLTTTATLTLPGDARLPDGNYRLALAANRVSDVAGNANLSPYTLTFGVLAGDVNGDGSTNFDDLLTVAQNFGTTGRTYGDGNLDYDPAGNVDFDDLLILAQTYGRSLTTAPLPAPAALRSASTTPAARRRDRAGSVVVGEAV